MSDDIRCVNCLHRSHENKPCPYCDPKNRCQEFVRPDVFMARSMARIENYISQSHNQMMMALATIFDLLKEAYPEATAALEKKIEENNRLAQEEMEKQRAKTLAEADAALAAAKIAEEERAMEKLAEGYTNVLPFPKIAEPDPDSDPDPEPEMA